MAKDTLTVTDNRTGRRHEIPLEHSAIRAADLRPLGLVSYDPAFANTASCTSRITYVDGEAGVLLYRGYPIEQLAEQSTFLETAYLLIKGELPSAERLAQWTHNITMHTIVHENVKQFMDGFRYDAHPMGMLVATVGALSTFYPDARRIHDPESRRVQTHRLLAKMPTIAAFAHRHAIGQPYVYPDNDLSYTGNFLAMMFKMTELKYRSDPLLERALDVLFILHADHEQNCSTNAMRAIGSSQVDPLSALAGACAALWGRLHGGADEAVLRMLAEIGSVAHVPAYLKRVKAGEARLVGFGHRVYRTFDPRGKVLKRLAAGVRGHRAQPPPGRRPRPRAHRARGRLLRRTPALSQRGLLLGHHLPGDGLPGGDVPGAVRHRAHRGLDRAVARDGAGRGADDRPPAAALPGPRAARLRTARGARRRRGVITC